MDSDAGSPSHSAAPQPSPSPSSSHYRWPFDATVTLIDAWGAHYLEIKGDALSQTRWQEITDAYNHKYGRDMNLLRTVKQCQDRIGNLKRSYNNEKPKDSESGEYVGNWPFFHQLDSYINLRFPPATESCDHRSGTQKIPARMEDSSFDPHYTSDSEISERRRRKTGLIEFGEVIESFGKAYERVEKEKQRQVVELEKERMQFAKDMNDQRMQGIRNTLLQLEKLNSPPSPPSSNSSQ